MTPTNTPRTASLAVFATSGVIRPAGIFGKTKPHSINGVPVNAGPRKNPPADSRKPKFAEGEAHAEAILPGPLNGWAQIGIQIQLASTGHFQRATAGGSRRGLPHGEVIPYDGYFVGSSN